MMGTAGVNMQGELHGFRLRLSSAVYFWKSGEKVKKVKKGEHHKNQRDELHKTSVPDF